MNKTGAGMLQIAGVCSVAAPVLLLITDLSRIFADTDFVWTIGMWISLMLLIPTVLAFTYLLSQNVNRLALLGGALAYFGLMAGASMQVLFRVYAVLREQGAAGTVGQLGSTFKLVASTQMIGIAWPLGLLILSLICFRLRSVSFIVPLLLLIGAIVFPIGRIGDLAVAVLISDAAFVIGFGLLAPRLFAAANGTAEQQV